MARSTSTALTALGDCANIPHHLLGHIPPELWSGIRTMTQAEKVASDQAGAVAVTTVVSQ